MRVLHTADWHMNANLGREDLSKDINRVLKQIAGYLEEYQVDVLLVAGDLFARSRMDQIRSAVREIHDTFLPFLQRGGTILAISGNHDNELFFETLRDALELVAPGWVASSNTDATGRLYIFPRPRVLRLANATGHTVQFVLMPYPTSSAYLRGEKITNWKTTEEKHQLLQQRFTYVLAHLEQQLDPRLPSVLVSHIHVRGSDKHILYHISEVDDVIFEPGNIPTHWTYAAYGHIHKPQCVIKGADHIRYAGSIQSLDAGEANDKKSVVLFEIGSDNSLVEPPVQLPLDTTPIYQIEIKDPDTQLANLIRDYPEADRALVYYTLHWEPGRHDRDTLCQQIHDIFPRWYGRSIKEIGRGLSQHVSFAPQHMYNVAGTVRDYLTTQISGHSQRDELIALAETFLAEEGWR
jgi:exonuclease SbcD